MSLFGRDSQKPPTVEPLPHVPSAPVHQLGPATLIAENTRMSGKISGTNDLRIEGEFDGTLNIDGDVSISSTGKVKATIKASRVTVSGRVTGNINGDRIIQLEPTACVVGDLQAPKILVKEGASLQGKVEMVRSGVATPQTDTKNAGKGSKKPDQPGAPDKPAEFNRPAIQDKPSP